MSRILAVILLFVLLGCGDDKATNVKTECEETSRYLQIFDSTTGAEQCVDSSNGRIVSYDLCSCS